MWKSRRGAEPKISARGTRPAVAPPNPPVSAPGWANARENTHRVEIPLYRCKCTYYIYLYMYISTSLCAPWTPRRAQLTPTPQRALGCHVWAPPQRHGDFGVSLIPPEPSSRWRCVCRDTRGLRATFGSSRAGSPGNGGEQMRAKVSHRCGFPPPVPGRVPQMNPTGRAPGLAPAARHHRGAWKASPKSDGALGLRF